MSGEKVLVKKSVLERRLLPKFGQCAGMPPGPEPNVTSIDNEWIDLRCYPVKEVVEEKSELDRLVESKASMKCSNCNEYGHWTLRCPKRRAVATDDGPEGSTPSSSLSSLAALSAAGSSRYTAPYRRVEDDDGDLTVRISNLMEDTTDNDFFSVVHEVCKKFNIREPMRTRVARIRNTDKARGFAFLTFFSKESAQAAAEAFNGYPFDTVILEAALAGRRERRDDSSRSKTYDDDRTDNKVDRDFNVAGSRNWRM